MVTRRTTARVHIVFALVLLGCAADDGEATSTDDGGSTETSAEGSSSGGESSTGLSPAEVCFACAGPLFMPGGECEAAIGVCVMDEECNAWNMCYEGCFVTDPQPTCFEGCKEDHPDAMALYDEVVSCVCGACSSECDPACQ